MVTPPPMVTAEGLKPLPPTGAITLNACTAMFYYATGITPAMVMRLPRVGSQLLVLRVDSSSSSNASHWLLSV